MGPWQQEELTSDNIEWELEITSMINDLRITDEGSKKAKLARILDKDAVTFEELSKRIIRRFEREERRGESESRGKKENTVLTTISK
jgi:hypothetical protein